LARTVANVMRGTVSVLNQLKDTLAGVLSINMPPAAAKSDPSRHKKGLLSLRKVRNQTPKISKPLPKRKLILIPCLLINQLQG